MLPRPCLQSLQQHIILLSSTSKHKTRRHICCCRSHHKTCFSKYGSPPSLAHYLVARIIDTGNLYFAQLVLDGVSMEQNNYISIWDSLINGFIRLGELRKSLTLHRIINQKCDSFLSSHTYVGLLKACAQLKDREKGSEIHDEIVSVGLLNSDPFVGVALIDMYVKCDSFTDARDLLNVLPVHNVVARNVLISGYLRKECFLDALCYFEEMKMAGVSPNEVTFSCMLKACSNSEDIGKGVEIHAEVCRKGLLRTNCYLGNGLIEMYAKTGNLTKAQEVFDELFIRNVVTWTVLIGGYAMNDHDEEAINCFEEMQIKGFAPNSITFSCVLKACGVIGAIDKCAEIHAEISRKGLLENDLFLSSALVDLYAKWGFLNKALEIFDLISTRNIATWTALLSGYAEHGRGHEALGNLERMKVESISPNMKTYVSALKACGSIEDHTKGIQIHASMGKSTFLETDLILGSALVSMYAKCGMVAKAQRVFDMLPDRNVVTWSALIMGYAQYKYDKEALKCLHLMREEGVHPNAVTFACTLESCDVIENVSKMHDEITMNGGLQNNVLIGSMLIRMYAKCGSLVKAWEVFETFVIRSTVIWNELIFGFVQHHRHDEALKCLEYMDLEGVSPNALTISCILKACGNIGSMNIAEKIHVEVARKGLLQRDLFIGTTLVDAYSKCGSLAKAKEVFDMLPIRNNVTWSTLISGYSQLGDMENAIFTFERMINEGGQKPDRITFVSILNACSHAGYVDKGHRYLELMIKHYGMSPSINHHACMVDLIGRAGQLCNALTIMTEIPFHPDSTMWLSVMGACHNWGNVNLGKHVLEQLVQLDAMDTAAYICMYNIFAQANIKERYNM